MRMKCLCGLINYFKDQDGKESSKISLSLLIHPLVKAQGPFNLLYISNPLNRFHPFLILCSELTLIQVIRRKCDEKPLHTYSIIFYNKVKMPGHHLWALG